LLNKKHQKKEKKKNKEDKTSQAGEGQAGRIPILSPSTLLYTLILSFLNLQTSFVGLLFLFPIFIG
jgi:hypothetical protein